MRRVLWVAGVALLLSAGCDVDSTDPVSEPVPSSLTSGGSNGALDEELSSYQKAVLEDGRVTRAELETSYSRLFDCLRTAGVEGEIWIALDLNTSYAGRLTVPGGGSSAAGPDESIGRCEGEYVSHVERAAKEQLPVASDARKDLLDLAKACLLDRLPDVAAEVEETSTMSDLRLRVFDLTPDPGSARIADECVIYYGIPFQPLDTATPS